MMNKKFLFAGAATIALFALSAESQARSSWGFSINTAPAYYPPPAYVVPAPPPPPPPVYYRPVYTYPAYYYPPAPRTGFSFSYHGR